ncbi:MAG: peptidylprolyl isomerase [Pseudomonadota bacterium]
MNRLFSLAMCCVAATLVLGCTQKPAGTPAEKVDNVAVVDGHPISRNTYNFYVKGVAKKPAEDLTPAQRAELLDNLVRGEVIAAAAEKDGTAARDETRAVLELTRLQVLQQASSQVYLKDRAPSAEELQAEYDLQTAQLSKTQYRASHILVPTQTAAQNIIDQLGKGASFADLAKRNSTDAGSKDRGGDLDWFSPEGMTPAFAAAVAAMKKGETTKVPVQTPFGWHVIRLVDTRESAPPPLDSVKDRLVQIVEGKKFKAYTDKLVASAKIEKTLESAPTVGAAPAAPAAAAPAPAPSAAPAKAP